MTRKPSAFTEGIQQMLILDNLFKSGADLGPGGGARAVCPILFWEVTLGHIWVRNFYHPRGRKMGVSRSLRRKMEG